MFRAISWTLQQRRYRMLAVAMLVLAIGCGGAGAFELHRYHEKKHANAGLVANAHVATVPLTPAVVALTGAGPAAGDAQKYRSVRIEGTYEPARQTFLDNQSLGGHQGYFVVTPLRTASGVLLVARGFVAATVADARPARISSPPAGVVTVVGRLYPAQSGPDGLGGAGPGEIVSVNAGQQAARLGAPVYQAWLALDAGQPGVAGLQALPGPQLDNPTGGASEPQLLSYVVQWWVFAVLALLAPFFIARGEARDAQRRFLGVDPDEVQFDSPPTRAQLPASLAEPSGALVRRARGEVAHAGPVAPRLVRAQRLADRYGRSLGPDVAPVADDGPPVPFDHNGEAVARSSRNVPHRGADDYHDTYNNYLWQLALADGDAPDVEVRDSARPRWQSVTEHGPRAIDATDADGRADAER